MTDDAPSRPWLFDAQHLLVVDLEATCDAKDFPPEAMEIIEIGAVVVRVSTWEICASFQVFVRPKESPTLTDFCQRLTGIQSEDLAEAPSLPDAMTEFVSWYGAYAPPVWASWGVFDRVQFRRDFKRYGLASPLPSRHLNLKSRYAEARAPGRSRPGMRQALAAEGIEFEGRQHRGLDDARNLVRLLGPIFDR